MSITPTYPGVYVREAPSGVRTIIGVGTSTTAFVGRARRGPVDVPVTVGSFGDFERTFGGLWADGPMTYAVRDFFLNGGSQAVVVRLYKDPGTTGGLATVTVRGLQLRAAEPGTWATGLSASLDTEGISDEVAARFGVARADLFNLTVRVGEVVERFANLTRGAGPRNVGRVLARESRIVRAEPAANAGETGEATDGTTPGVDSAPLGSTELLGSQGEKTGLYALEKGDHFNLLCIPPDERDGDTPSDVYQAAAAYCAAKRAVLLVDPPAGWDPLADAGTVLGTITGTDARNAALYFPRLQIVDAASGGDVVTVVPCGAVAGVLARTDAQRGVWKAPAGVDAGVTGIVGPAVNLTDEENGRLNPLGINCLRSFPVSGTVIWGARTLRGADQLADEYKYLPVRRLALHIEEALLRGCQWAVHEPNDEPLWSQLRLNVGAFLHGLFRQGAFAGQSPRDAYFVKCDAETTTPADVDQGIVNIVVGFAPLKPAEFVVITIQQIAGPLQA